VNEFSGITSAALVLQFYTDWLLNSHLLRAAMDCDRDVPRALCLGPGLGCTPWSRAQGLSRTLSTIAVAEFPVKLDDYEVAKLRHTCRSDSSTESDKIVAPGDA
jgi:hypothetical protein